MAVTVASAAYYDGYGGGGSGEASSYASYTGYAGGGGYAAPQAAQANYYSAPVRKEEPVYDYYVSISE